MKRKTLLIVIVLFLILSGCTQNSDQPSAKDNQLPSSLLSIELIEERIIKQLENSQAKKEKKQKSNSKQSKSKEETSTPKLWNNITDDIKKLHRNWNQYKSQSSIADKKLKRVDRKLDQLTETAEQEKLLLTMVSLNQFHLQLAKIYSIYDTQKGQIKRSEGYVRNIIYFPQLGKADEKVLTNVNKLEATASSLQEKIGTKQSIRELIVAIDDLKRAVNNDNYKVVEIKGELILNKLEALKSKTN